MLKVKAFVAVAAIAVIISAASGQQASAQETMQISTSTYADLMRRVEALESTAGTAVYESGPTYQTCEPGRAFVNYDSVIVAPFFSNNSAFIAENDPGLENVGFDWNLKYSPRLEMGYMAPTGELGWRARWWHFDAGTAFFADDANGLIPSDEAEVFYALDVRLEDIDTGTFSHEIRMDTIDLEVTKSIGHNLTLFVGGRFLDASQEFRAVTDAGDAVSTLDFTGAGPTMGLRLDHHVTENWLLFAGVRGSILFGDKNFFANTDDADLPLLLDQNSSLTYAGEIQIGTEYRRNNWFLTLALEAQYWSGFGSALPNHIAADDGANIEGDGYNPLNTDLGFLGLSVGAGLDF